MIPPAENEAAFFPLSVKVGRIRLGPLTLSGVVRLGALGISTNERVPEGHLLEAAAVLAGEDYRKFLRSVRGIGMKELAHAVEKQLNAAYATWIKPAPPEKAPASVSLTPKGLGWALEYAEWLCAEYGWSFAAAIETPVATVFALAAACRERNGGKHAGLDYVERWYQKEVKAGRARMGGL